MKYFILIIYILTVSSVHLSQNIINATSENLCESLAIPNITFKDTLDMDGFYHVFESPVLSNPTDTIFLIYTDSLAVYDPENYSEYIMLIKRKVPLQLLK